MRGQHLDQNHGQMQWTGEFDTEEYAVFACERCPYKIGLKPGADQVHKMIKPGWVAAHYARTNQDVIDAVQALGLWQHLQEQEQDGQDATENTD